jgi:hypothetical protein
MVARGEVLLNFSTENARVRGGSATRQRLGKILGMGTEGSPG